MLTSRQNPTSPPRDRWSHATWACVGAVLLALALDAYCGPLAVRGQPLLWLEPVALLALVLAAARPGALRSAAAWQTPLAGIMLGALVLALVQVAGRRGAPGAWGYVRHVAACSALFVALVALLRRDRLAGEPVWVGLALGTLALGGEALWAALHGTAALRADGAAVDVRWFGHHALAKTLLFTTLATAGRALEPGASRRWRLVVLIGLAGLAVHVLVGGVRLDERALARLDDPVYFSTACVTVMVALSVARRAWTQVSGRAPDALRWRFLALATAAMGVSAVLGEGSGGEAVRALVVVGAAAVVAMPLAPEHLESLPAWSEEAEPAEPAEPELRRAA